MATKPTELFVNASWTNKRKVPKTTPYGVELRYEPSSAGAKDRNAFQTLEEAQRYASTRELFPVVYHTYDKKVEIDNASLKLGNIRSQEIKSTVNDNPAKWSWSAKSTIKASASIIVKDTAANNMDIAGFQDVTIYNRSRNSGGYTVHGGSNTVSHSFVVTGPNTMRVTHKDSATIRGIATGTLTVTGGARVIKADGAWASAESTSGGIASDNSAFIPSAPGLPELPEWGSQLMDSPLKTGLPGYSRVILDIGAKADVLYGGRLSYDHISDATYALTNPSRTKSCTYLTVAVGTLAVSSSAVLGSAYNYENVVISGGDFTLLQGGSTYIAGKTTYVVPNDTGHKATSESVSSSAATGKLTLFNLANKTHARNVSGYATVTITNTALDSVNAASFRLYEKETEEKTKVNGKTKITYTHTDSKTYSQNGELSNPKGKVGGTFNKDVVGFGTVNLTSATFGGKLAAVVFETPTEYYPESTYFYASGNYSSSVSRVSSAGVKVQGKLNEKFTCTALGGVTLSASEVSESILGYRTVNLNNVKVGLGISAGGTSFDNSSNMSSSLDGSFSSSLINRRNSTTAIGTLNMTGGSLGGGAIYEFATVTLNGVKGNVGRMDALNETVSRRFNLSSGGALLDESYVSRYAAGVGNLTVNQGGELKIKGINGYNKIAMTGGSITNGIDQGWVSRSYDSSRLAYDSKAGTKKFSSNFFNSSAFAGVVQLKNVTVAAGGIHGYQKVTLDDSIVSGGIGRLDKGSPSPGPSPAPVPVDPVIYAPNFSSRYESAEYDNGGTRLVKSSAIIVTSTAATMELTLARGAKVYGDVIGAKTIATSNGGIAQINGTVDMSSEKIYVSSSVVSDFKKGQATATSASSYLHSATGTLTANGLFVTGNIVGAAKVTASVLIAGDIDGTTTSSYYKNTYGLGNSGAITQITGSSSYIDSATGAATLTSGAVVGDLLGFGTVKLTDGVIGNANGWTDKDVRFVSATSSGVYASTTANHNVGNSFSAQNAHVSGGIFGYKSIVLEGYLTTVEAGIDAEQYKDSLVISNAGVSGSVVGQTLTRENSQSAMGELTLKKAAEVKSYAYGVRVANLTDAALVGELTMSAASEKETNKLTSNTKTKLFEQNWQYSSGVAGGNLTLKNSYIDSEAGAVPGGVYGAANVTITNGVIEGDVSGIGSSTYSSSIVAKGSKIDSVSVLTEDTVNIDSDSAVEWTEKYIRSDTAAGSFKMTDGTVAGAIENFANVNLMGNSPDYTSVGRVKGGFVTDSFSHVYKDKTDIFTASYNEGVLGTLTAYDVTFTDANVLAEGFATVVLMGCSGNGGSIWGGRMEETRRGVGSGANFTEARAKAGSAGGVWRYTAAGAVTATDTDLDGGSIINCATVTLAGCNVGDVTVEAHYSGAATLTLAGSNFVGDIDGYSSLSVKNGATSAGYCTGTSGNDTFTVNAGASLDLRGCDFQGGSDKAVVNGLVRLYGEFDNSDKLAFSGNGNVAVTERNYIAITNAIARGALGDVTFTGGIELINAGATDDLLSAIRTKKEELADNTAKGAVKFDGGEMNGWLSGEEDEYFGKFADTADWIKFKYDDDYDYAVVLDSDRRNDVQVELCKNGTAIQGAVRWDGDRFDIDEDKLTAGTEYQLAINIADGKSALKYSFIAEG